MLTLLHSTRRGAAAACFLLVLTGLLHAQRQPAPAVYFPDRLSWETRRPGQAGMDPARLDAAIAFAIANENPATKDLAVDLATTFGGREPFDTPIGPIQPRGALNGIVVRNGYVVA